MAQNAQQVLDNLLAARDALLQEIAAGPLKPSYSVGGQSVSWSEYSEALLRRLTTLNNLIQLAGGPQEIVTQGTTGAIW